MNILFQRLKHGETSGQMVVALVLFLAVMVVFMAVVMNLGKIAQTKTLISVAADAAAIGMASAAGSMAYSMKLKGFDNMDSRCILSEGMRWFMVIFIIIVDILSFGSATAATASLLTHILFWTGVALEVIGMAVWVVVSNGQKDQWSKKMDELTKDQRYVETAIQTALLNAVGDLVTVADNHDTNTNGDYAEKVGRFAVLYDERLTRYIVDPNSPQKLLRAAIDLFRPAWEQFACFVGLDDGAICTDASVHNVVKDFIGYDNGDGEGNNDGIFKVFYRAKRWGWAYGSYSDTWKPGYRPCSKVLDIGKICGLAGACAQNNYCCSSPDACLAALPTEDDDTADKFKQSEEAFVDWSKSYLSNGVFMSRTDYLLSSFNSWYPMLFKRPPPGLPVPGITWYEIINLDWQSSLNLISAALQDINAWISSNTIATLCDSKPAECTTQLQQVQSTINAWTAGGGTIAKINQAIGAFLDAVYRGADNLVQKIEAIVWWNTATYSWKDEVGWHHVKVEVEVPCHFPSVGEIDSGDWAHECWGLTPLFRGITYGGGTAMVTVTRYDEDRDPMAFINNSPLWRFMYTHPSSTLPQGYAYVSGAKLSSCEPGDKDPGLMPPGYSKQGEAGFNCDRGSVDEALSHGVMSRSCVEWGPNPGDVKFVDCNRAYMPVRNNSSAYCKY